MAVPAETDPHAATWRALEPLVLSDERMLGDRAYQLAVVRLALATTIVVGALVGRYVEAIREEDLDLLVRAGVATMLYDVVAWRVAAVRRGRTDQPDVLRVVQFATYGAIVLDYLTLAFVARHTGGARSPVLAFFLLHAIVSGAMLGKKPALVFHGFAYALLTGLVVAEWAGIVAPPPADAVIAGGTGPLDGRYVFTLVATYGLMFAITGFVLTSFSSNLRRSERQIREANAELTRLSEMRRDFLDIALHNLQSPIAACRMHVGNIRSGLGGPVTDSQAQWLDRTMERLEHLSEFMRSLSILSTLESVRIEDRAAPVDLPHLLAEIVHDHQDAAQGRKLVLGLGTPVPPVRLRGMEILLREAVVNYVTNSIKYVPEGGHVVVRARETTPGRIRIEVGDDGAGISEEDQKRLFQEFVRLREKGKPVPKSRGSGLGLTIVRRVATLHRGSAGVTSTPGQGSTFWIDLPCEPVVADAPHAAAAPADGATGTPVAGPAAPH